MCVMGWVGEWGSGFSYPLNIASRALHVLMAVCDQQQALTSCTGWKGVGVGAMGVRGEHAPLPSPPPCVYNALLAWPQCMIPVASGLCTTPSDGINPSLFARPSGIYTNCISYSRLTLTRLCVGRWSNVDDRTIQTSRFIYSEASEGRAKGGLYPRIHLAKRYLKCIRRGLAACVVFNRLHCVNATDNMVGLHIHASFRSGAVLFGPYLPYFAIHTDLS